MALFGDLSSMALPDLLQWAAQTAKTGTLELERHKHVKRIHFRKGRLIGCSSEDPPSLLGQFLLARGKITEAQLGEGLARQQQTRDNLGNILVEMGAISREDLVRHVAEKAEETIYGLFDWPDASFRFIDDAPPDPWVIEVDLRVEDVLLHGMRRVDEMKRMREVFDNPAIVLRRTAKAPPPEVTNHKAANAIYGAVDGQRCLEELSLHSHASEFFVMKFLFQLLRSGLVEVCGASKMTAESQGFPSRAASPAGEAPPAAGADAGAMPRGPAADGRLAGEIEAALHHLSRNEPEAALAVLCAAYRAHPGDPTLSELIGKAEDACRENAMRTLDPSAVPRLTKPLAELAGESLSATESYLTTLFDGKSDVRTILWVAPMREIDVLHALKNLLGRGLIELRSASL